MNHSDNPHDVYTAPFHLHYRVSPRVSLRIKPDRMRMPLAQVGTPRPKRAQAAREGLMTQTQGVPAPDSGCGTLRTPDAASQPQESRSSERAEQLWADV